MSPDELVKTIIHPYKKYYSPLHQHFLETDIVYPAYSFVAKPFAWMMKDRMVRSKSEVIIADCLHYNDLLYEYEPVLELEPGKPLRPDFKVLDGDTGEVWYWEHCGVMNDPKYVRRWEDKKKFYEKHGIVEGKNLIVTYDDENGGLDSGYIDQLIKDTFDT